MVRYGRDMSPEDEACALFHGLSVPEVRSLLRHPAWPDRCACRHYGMPYEANLCILDDDAAHETHRCQPRREYIEAP